MYKLKDANVAALVAGDFMLDSYLWGKCGRISPEAPVPIVEIERESTLLGGAGNVINNLLTFGAKVYAAGVLGGDECGAELLNLLENSGVNTDAIVKEPTRKTSRKTRLVASRQQIVRFDKESKTAIADTSKDALLTAIFRVLPSVNIVLLSDYGKGVLTPEVTQKVINEAKKLGKKVLVDPKGSDYSKYKNASIVTPNRKEAGEATRGELKTLAEVREAGMKLRGDLNLDYAIITLSEDGMMICGDRSDHIAAEAREVYDVTGAGDTVLSSLGFALAAGFGIEEAARFANLAAAVVVSKVGSATATIDEILSYEYRHSINQSPDKVIPLNRLVAERERIRAADRKVVFTNGCFDILHKGHIEYLQKSREEGDLLIVGLNSDRSVRAIKGDSRPVNCEGDRAFILAALPFVDFVVIFDEDTPIKVIEALKPDILTKGADYKDKEVVGSKIAGKVVLVDLTEGRSTSNVIRKIKDGK
ncbi:MAG: D-glycero-beta-D-manno-heptose-7-phosphate kinase [Helicobacteraceae bacterium]|jgi:D-beta-D-heptose 7-phosphate kinase/D-beta-D-heptose 1-phosphate adenosyltransferase|nr:D-glycero-beta-D-manno-heptose-7-phosphate kinase [Helicobacteraceae bacterium]